MKVNTRPGDDGQTTLLSDRRVYKDHLRLDASGTVDEANAAMGLAKSLINEDWAKDIIQEIQTDLIALNADLATEGAQPGHEWRITLARAARLEEVIDALDARRIPQRHFVTPGQSAAGAALDLARTIARRAERCVVRLRHGVPATSPILLYMNRLSDLLYVMARCVEQDEIVAAVVGEVISELAKGPKEKVNDVTELTLSRAKQLLAAAEAKALAIGVPMVIAVVDDGGNLVAQHRMDGSLLASIRLALDKAYTAAALNTPTGKLTSLTVPGQPVFGLNTACEGRFIVFGGGLPIVKDGRLLGGLGVSGGTPDEDTAVAEAALACW